MGRQHDSVTVQCPYYRSEKQQSVCCEGMDGATIHLVFSSSFRKKEFYREKCCRDFKKCHIAQMQYRRYGEEDQLGK